MIEIIGSELYQWDVDRQVKVTEIEASHVHFANQWDSKASVVELVESVAVIPNYLFMTGKQLLVYAVNNGVTVESKTFPVKKRECPADYIYEDDHRNYIYKIITDVENAVADAEKVAEDLRTAKENGEFNGPQGPQGEKGDKGDTGLQGEQGSQGAPGEPGYTPQRGTDYWTEEDKAEIKSYVDDRVSGTILEATVE